MAEVYYYARLNTVTRVCTGVYEVPEEIISPDYIRIDSLDESLIGKKYNDETGEFETSGPDDLANMLTSVISHNNQWLNEALGTLANLQTTHKVSLVGAINECFQSVSNGKTVIGDAITDKDSSITIPENPTFADLATAIGLISSGMSVATGHIQDFTFPAKIEGKTPFMPKIVIIYNNTSGITNFNLGVYVSTTIVGGTTNQINERLTGTSNGIERSSGINFTILEDGFSMNNKGMASNLFWIALG